MYLYEIGFWVLAVITVAAAFAVVLNRNPLVSALFLALTFLGASGLILLLDAPFLAFIQVLIYAGAIVVLFIYVIMLLDLAPERVRGTYGILAKFLGAAVFVSIVLALVFSLTGMGEKIFPQMREGYSGVKALANELFLIYVVPFELISIVLLIGIIGAVLLVKNIGKKE